MQCPYCACEESKVIDKRTSSDGSATRRRRECLGCTKRFTTYEHAQAIDIYIIKKDGTKQAFSKQKIINSITIAAQKRPVTPEQIANIASLIERKVMQLEQNEIPSRKIGDFVMRQLKKVDEVAYIRFASVYKSFKDIDDFSAMVSKISGK